jgi:xanthine dehydrogenase accessory factor
MTTAELLRPLNGAIFDWPMFGLQSDVRPALALAVATKTPAVLATLVGVVGGAPLGVGAQMAFVGESVTGFLSGGCIEADVALHAKEVLRNRKPKRLVYGEGGPWDIQLPCGSKIEVLLERIEPDSEALHRLMHLTEERRAAIWFTNGEQRFCASPGAIDHVPSLFGEIAGRAAFASDICESRYDPFSTFRRFVPPIQLIVVGGDPITMAVTKLALDVGMEVILVRPRGPKDCPLPVTRYLRSDAAEALAMTRPDERTAIAVLTHDAEQEQMALAAALATKARYIGALGSLRRVPARNRRLRAAGYDAAEIDRIKAPIGLPISGKAPWSIAVSIIAEIFGEFAEN